MVEELFDVYFVYPEGFSTVERLGVPIEEAVNFACLATGRPAAMMGLLPEIIITDEDDNCVFKWRYGQGVVFPSR